MGIFYKPTDGYAADFIPFYHGGQYHLFYLKDYRDNAKYGEGTPWFRVSTRDFVQFEDHGEAIPRGPIGAQDRWIFTGCAMEHAGVFHIFYTGHNFHYPPIGRAKEAVMHATSSDMKTWTKDEGFAVFAPTADGYERDDWRDPFVFWNPDDNEWGMLLAARKSSGPSRHRGCVAYLASSDLKSWTVREPFWQPELFYTHECPDLFKMGEWWYLVWSEFSDRHCTRYRMSRSLRGPWIAPPDDAFDARGYYAAKTASDGDKRCIFGWLATRDGEKDSGHWQWGGSLVVHELQQRADGTLAVRMPPSVGAAFKQRIETRLQPITGNWVSRDGGIECKAPSRFSAALLGEMPAECCVSTTITFEAGTQSCGLLLRATDDLGKQYQVRLEPSRQRIVVDRWPRPGEQSFIFERPLNLQAGKPVSLTCLVRASELVVYANDQVALSCRMYDSPSGAAGVFVSEGSAQFGAVEMLGRV